jgi:hypothetical protein
MFCLWLHISPGSTIVITYDVIVTREPQGAAYFEGFAVNEVDAYGVVWMVITQAGLKRVEMT